MSVTVAVVGIAFGLVAFGVGHSGSTVNTSASDTLACTAEGNAFHAAYMAYLASHDNNLPPGFGPGEEASALFEAGLLTSPTWKYVAYARLPRSGHSETHFWSGDGLQVDTSTCARS